MAHHRSAGGGASGGGGAGSIGSIGTKIQGLQDRLRKEGDTLVAPPPPPPPVAMATPDLKMPHRRTRPHLSLSSRKRGMELQVQQTGPAPATDTVHSERLRQIRRVLVVGGAEYSSDVKDMIRLSELGSGTCGQVTKMLHKPSNSVIAVKQMRRSGNSEENKRILMDLDVVLRSHSCPYIVKCLGCFITEDEVWICMELMASCFDKILKKLNGPIPEEILGKITLATVKALSYLKEEHEVIHRDVKPSNILIDENGVIKLCDFGISGWLVDSKAKTRNAGCAAYMAPERIDPPDPQKPDYDIRADVWSLGITLVELATGHFPYKDCQNDFEVLSKVIGEEPPALPDSDKFSPEFKSFVQQCLTKNYRHRPKYAALLDHPFLQKAEASDAKVDEWLKGILSPTSPQRLMPSVFSLPDPILDNQATSKETSSDLSQLNHSDKDSSQKTSLTLTDTADNSSIIDSDIVDKGVGDSLNRMQMDDPETSSVKAANDSVNQDSSMTSLDHISQKSTEPLIPNTKVQNFPSEKTPRFVRANPEYSSLNSYIKHNPITYNRDYYVQPPTPRNRSYSNTMVYGNNSADKYPPARFICGSPNTKNYFANLDARNQPFSGGGPSSLEGVVNPVYGRDPSEYMHHYRSPEVARRQFFSPTRKPNYHENPRETHRNIVSPPNFAIGYEDREPTFSPPQFRHNGPTNYFNPPCPVSRFAPNSMGAAENMMMGGAYHHNPGGSCSQPASLETYDENRPYPHRRLNEKCYSPALWSPQPAARRALHIKEREDRDKEYRRTVESPHHHLQGNTSPIVLQRFYHQQSQRRSRRDLRDGSPHHKTSVSREPSIGRSPEPPRRAHRDPSLGRNTTPPHNVEQLLRDRCERERLSLEHNRVSDAENYPSINLNTHPDLIKTHAPRYDMSNLPTQSTVTLMKDRFEMRNIANDWSDKSSNGDINDRSRTHERFEPRLGHARQLSDENGKDKDVRTRKNGERVNGDVKDKEKSRMSPLVLRKKGHSKDKDEQVGHHHRSSSASAHPVGPPGSSPVTRSTRFVPARHIGDPELDSPDIGKRMQECSHNFVPAYRYGGVPQPPPRRMAESWSLPGSPLPARPT